MERNDNDNGWKNFKEDVKEMWTQVQATWFWLSFPALTWVMYLYFTVTAREWGKFALWLYYPEFWFWPTK